MTGAAARRRGGVAPRAASAWRGGGVRRGAIVALHPVAAFRGGGVARRRWRMARQRRGGAAPVPCRGGVVASRGAASSWCGVVVARRRVVTRAASVSETRWPTAIEREREIEIGERDREGGGGGGSHPRDAAAAEEAEAAMTTTSARRRRNTAAASARGCPMQWRRRRSRERSIGQKLLSVGGEDEGAHREYIYP
uniref:Uncharacterized protein n=1 Tax=Oryza glaberrima TaxID=4538 RepID=A0A1V1H5F8_ORYGL|nr:hypothetical protein [Oryza glaberrima]